MENWNYITSFGTVRHGTLINSNLDTFLTKILKNLKILTKCCQKGVIQWEIVENRSWIIKTGGHWAKASQKMGKSELKKGVQCGYTSLSPIFSGAPSPLRLGYSISLSLCNPPSYPIWTSMGDKSSRAIGGVGISNGSAKLKFYLKSTHPLCSNLVKSTTEHYAKSVWISYGNCPMGLSTGNYYSHCGGL